MLLALANFGLERMGRKNSGGYAGMALLSALRAQNQKLKNSSGRRPQKSRHAVTAKASLQGWKNQLAAQASIASTSMPSSRSLATLQRSVRGLMPSRSAASLRLGSSCNALTINSTSRWRRSLPSAPASSMGAAGGTGGTGINGITGGLLWAPA